MSLSSPGRRAPARDSLYIVGVTGGTATGKSTFVEELARHGPARVVSADRVGHAVLEQPEVARQLAAAFGMAILDSEGRVDRARLGPLAFADHSSLERLNAIVHPPLLEELRLAIDEATREHFAGMLVLDAALLVEWDLGSWCDCVVAVVAPSEAQVARLARDRNLDPEEARRRLALQLPHATRARYADDTLENEGSLAAYRARARALAERLWREARAELAARGHPLS